MSFHEDMQGIQALANQIQGVFEDTLEYMRDNETVSEVLTTSLKDQLTELHNRFSLWNDRLHAARPPHLEGVLQQGTNELLQRLNDATSGIIGAISRRPSPSLHLLEDTATIDASHNGADQVSCNDNHSIEADSSDFDRKLKLANSIITNLWEWTDCAYQLRASTPSDHQINSSSDLQVSGNEAQYTLTQRCPALVDKIWLIEKVAHLNERRWSLFKQALDCRKVHTQQHELNVLEMKLPPLFSNFPKPYLIGPRERGMAIRGVSPGVPLIATTQKTTSNIYSAMTEHRQEARAVKRMRVDFSADPEKETTLILMITILDSKHEINKTILTEVGEKFGVSPSRARTNFEKMKKEVRYLLKNGDLSTWDSTNYFSPMRDSEFLMQIILQSHHDFTGHPMISASERLGHPKDYAKTRFDQMKSAVLKKGFYPTPPSSWEPAPNPERKRKAKVEEDILEGTDDDKIEIEQPKSNHLRKAVRKKAEISQEPKKHLVEREDEEEDEDEDILQERGSSKTPVSNQERLAAAIREALRPRTSVDSGDSALVADTISQSFADQEGRQTDARHFCCFCNQNISSNVCQDLDAYIAHIVEDLQPFFCTFDQCSAGPFQTQIEWFYHEIQTHRSLFLCPWCKEFPPSSRHEVANHIDVDHSDIAKHLEENNRDRYATLDDCKHWPEQLLNTDCQFCGGQFFFSDTHLTREFPVPNKEFEAHVARHMIEIASLSMPVIPEFDINPSIPDMTGFLWNTPELSDWKEVRMPYDRATSMYIMEQTSHEDSLYLIWKTAGKNGEHSAYRWTTFDSAGADGQSFAIARQRWEDKEVGQESKDLEQDGSDWKVFRVMRCIEFQQPFVKKWL